MRNDTFCLLAILATLLFAASGCDSGEAEAASYREIVAVEMASVSLGPHAVPAPTPEFTKTCPDCNGKGRVKTGDGISMTDCSTCDGLGKIVEGALPMLPWVREVPATAPFLPAIYRVSAPSESLGEVIQIKALYSPENTDTTLVAYAPVCANSSCAIAPVRATAEVVRKAHRRNADHRFRFRQRTRRLFRGVSRGACGLFGGGCG